MRNNASKIFIYFKEEVRFVKHAEEGKKQSENCDKKAAQKK
jgi:hypothetical protein